MASRIQRIRRHHRRHLPMAAVDTRRPMVAVADTNTVTALLHHGNRRMGTLLLLLLFLLRRRCLNSVGVMSHTLHGRSRESQMASPPHTLLLHLLQHTHRTDPLASRSRMGIPLSNRVGLVATHSTVKLATTTTMAAAATAPARIRRHTEVY